jgi:Spy/CpxP family protein refolding chaperone
MTTVTKPNGWSVLVLFVLFILAAGVFVSAQDQPQAAPAQPAGSCPPNCPGMMSPNAGAPQMLHRPGMMMQGGGMMQERRGPEMGPAGPGRMMPGGRGMRRNGLGPGMPGPQPDGMTPGPRILMQLRRPEIQQSLGLTAEQTQKLKDFGFEHQKQSIQERANVELRRLELSRLMGAENADKAAIDKKVDEIAQAEAALMKSALHAEVDARAVLTKEQKAKLPQLLQGPPPPRAGPPAPAAPARKAND